MSSKLLESVRMVWDTLWGLVSPPPWGIRPKIAYTVQLYMIWYYHQLFDLIVSEIAMQGVWWVSQKVEVPEARVIFAKRRSSRRHFCSSASSPQCLPCVWVVSQNSWRSKSHLCIEDGPTLLNNHSTPLHPVCLLSSRCSRFSVIVWLKCVDYLGSWGTWLIHCPQGLPLVLNLDWMMWIFAKKQLWFQF